MLHLISCIIKNAKTLAIWQHDVASDWCFLLQQLNMSRMISWRQGLLATIVFATRSGSAVVCGSSDLWSTLNKAPKISSYVILCHPVSSTIPLRSNICGIYGYHVYFKINIINTESERSTMWRTEASCSARSHFYRSSQSLAQDLALANPAADCAQTGRSYTDPNIQTMNGGQPPEAQHAIQVSYRL